ncbi:hypothetical protein JYT83_01060 [bacterium AH-315-F18]|nr:hypothetical protein [bacterium AH-315-F18]
MQQTIFEGRPGLSLNALAAWPVLLLGAALVLFGVTVLLVPQILVALVSGLFIMIGITCLGLGWRMRRSPGLNRPSATASQFETRTVSAVWREV